MQQTLPALQSLYREEHAFPYSRSSLALPILPPGPANQKPAENWKCHRPERDVSALRQKLGFTCTMRVSVLGSTAGSPISIVLKRSVYCGTTAGSTMRSAHNVAWAMLTSNCRVKSFFFKLKIATADKPMNVAPKRHEKD